MEAEQIIPTLHKLPLGLTRYAGRKFEELHGPGCKCITASSIPELFGVGRVGRMALSAHAIGVIPFDPVDNALTRRGHMMQNLVSGWYADDTGLDTKSVHAWVKHQDMPFYASPDAIIRPRSENPLPGEVKVVANAIYNETWIDAPPSKVLLQHQAQLELTGANSGPVIAATIGDFEFGLHHWDIEANPDVQEAIILEVKEFLSFVLNNQITPPDLSDENDQESVVKMAEIIEGSSIDLGDEVMFHIKRYQRIGKLTSTLEKKRKEAKAFIVNALEGHQFGNCPSGQIVSLTEVAYAAQQRAPYTQRRMNIKAAPKSFRSMTSEP